MNMVINKKKAIACLSATAMAACMALPFGGTASASNIADADGGSAASNVSLWTTVDGTTTGTPSATALSVTVPTVLSVAVGTDGTVNTADSAQITNNSYGAVKVSQVDIAAENGWKLTAFGDKDSLAGEKVDSDQFGFEMSIGGGAALQTDDSNTGSQNLLDGAITGCYMTGVGDASGNKVAIDYDAIVTPVSEAVTDEDIADITFVVEWDK